MFANLEADLQCPCAMASSGLAMPAATATFSTWMQIIVVDTLECPKSSCTVRISVPTCSMLRLYCMYWIHSLYCSKSRVDCCSGARGLTEFL
jgi:hypothetical protein